MNPHLRIHSVRLKPAVASVLTAKRRLLVKAHLRKTAELCMTQGNGR